MNSLNKHIPTIVFLLGLFLLVISMRAFFMPSSSPAVPLPAISAPAPATEGASVQGSAPARRPSPSYVAKFHRVAPTHVETSNHVIDDFLRQKAETHLKSVGLTMRIPKGMQFSETDDGPIRILTGSNGPKKDGLFLFSAKGNYSASRAFKYIQDYFKDEFSLSESGKPSTYSNGMGFNRMVLFKGSTSQGEEFQAYFFHDPKSGQSHMLILKDSQLSRHPAVIRQLVDSIQSARPASSR
jgi:hypothetical protein